MSIVISFRRAVPSRQKRCGVSQALLRVFNAAIGCIPVPGLSVAFAVFQVIFEAVEMVQSNKEELIVMKNCIRVLLRAVNEQYTKKKLKLSSTRTTVAELTELLQEIAAFVKEKASQSFFRQILTKDAVRTRIQGYYTRLQFTIQAFQIVALVNIEAFHHEANAARKKDQLNLNITLAQLPADYTRLKKLLADPTDRTGDQFWDAILKTMQQRVISGNGDKADLQFFERTIQHLPAEERKRRLTEVPHWTISQFDVEREAAIGTGGYGTVYRGTWRKQTVALKVMKTKDGVYPNPGLICNEVVIWESLKHPNIMKFLGANILDDEPFIVMPLAKYGNAKVYLKAKPDVNRAKLIKDVACGLVYLHQDKRIVHGDIKAVNILIDQVDGERRALLCDFGLASIKHDIETRSSVKLSSLVGTRNYMAPEMFKGAPARFPSDIYALGMTMYEIFTGEVPLGYIGPDLLLKLVVKHNTRPERPTAVEAPQITDDLWTLITQCWSRTPEGRPTATQVHATLVEIASRPRHRPRADSPAYRGRPGTPRPHRHPGTPGLHHDRSNIVAARSPNLPSSTPASITPTPRSILKNPEPSAPGPRPSTRTRASPSPGRRRSGGGRVVVVLAPTVQWSSSLPIDPRPGTLQLPTAPSIKHSPSSSSRSPSPIPPEVLARTTTIGFPMRRPWRTCFALSNPAYVTTVSLSPNGDALVAGLASGHFEIWNPRKATKTSLETESRRTIAASPITASSTLSASESSFALGLANGAVAQHHMDVGVSVERFDNRERVRCICLITGGEGKADKVIILNRAGEIVLWPTSLDQAEAELASRVIRVPELRKAPVTCGSFSPDGSLLFVGTANGCLYIINTSTGHLTHDPLPYGDAPPPSAQPPSHSTPNARASARRRADRVSCESLTPSPDGRKVLVGYSMGEIRLWDVKRGSKIIMRGGLSPSVPKLPNHSVSLAFSSDGSKIAYPSLQLEKSVDIQDVLSKQIVATVQLQSDASREQEGLASCPDRRIQTIALTKDNRMLVVSFEKSTDVMVWLW